MNLIAVFFISFTCISLELFLTRILYLKAWNHTVYTVIPFALLGFGVGANILLVFQNQFRRCAHQRIVAGGLFLLAALLLPMVYLLIRSPLHIQYLMTLLSQPHSVLMLARLYALFMLPFIPAGFLIAYIFRSQPEHTHRLYLCDMIGAGLGSVAFVALIRPCGIFPAIALLAVTVFFLGLTFINKRRLVLCLAWLVICAAVIRFIPPIREYRVDPSKGWEWIPGYYPAAAYETVVSRWHPLGRTDCYRIKDDTVRQDLTQKNFGTFLINLEPPLPLTYCVTNFLSGTPVYKFQTAFVDNLKLRLKPFSTGFETPYLLLHQPRVVIIGAGGGRDIFFAKTHRAAAITGAEINPEIFRQMTPGGRLYDYSGRIYTSRHTRIFNVDGRHLIRTLKPDSQNLILLNAADTFSGLSTGAYAYAETYLYTKEAVQDYLRVLNNHGLINFVRWIDLRQPKETLRLFILALNALESVGAEEPWQNIILGYMGGWSVLLIKKTAFTPVERQTVRAYFKKIGIKMIFPTVLWEQTGLSEKIAFQGQSYRNYFEIYAQALMSRLEEQFIRAYPYDVSVVTDNRPFFYKYYKWKFLNPLKMSRDHHHSPVIFMTQIFVLLLGLVFILLFLLVPLWIFQRRGLKTAGRSVLPLLAYFGGLGLGYMLTEISLLQRLVILLGSPIYSLSVTLPVLLISTGIGSGLSGVYQKYFRNKKLLLALLTVFITLYLILFVVHSPWLIENGIGLPFPARMAVVALMVLPLGLGLGVYFPIGLRNLGEHSPESMPWAFGINAACGVLGGMLAIILAQFFGFDWVLGLAGAVYWLAVLAFSCSPAVKSAG